MRSDVGRDKTKTQTKSHVLGEKRVNQKMRVET